MTRTFFIPQCFVLNIGIQGTGDLRSKMDGKDVKENFVFVKYFSDKTEKE